MAGGNNFFIIVPAVYGMFALALTVLAVVERKLVNARWAAAGFFVAGISITLDRYRDYASADWAAWLTIATHFVALLAMMQAFIARHEPGVPFSTRVLVVAGCTLMFPMVPWDVPMALRSVLVQGIGAAIIVSGSIALWRYRAKSWIDQLAFFANCISASMYTARSVLSAFYPAGQSREQIAEFYSFISTVFHLTSSIMAILVGILVLVSIGRDMIQSRIEESEIDPLTGLGNRRRMARLIEADAETQTKSCDRRIGAAMVIDLDHFKRINDVYGHEAGDEVLMRVGEKLRSMIGPFGEVCRTGGEEFVALIEQAHAPSVTALSLGLRKGIAAMEFDGAIAEISVTASIGICVRDDESEVEVLIRKADQAVYCAKSDGRDRVVQAEDQSGLQVLKAVA